MLLHRKMVKYVYYILIHFLHELTSLKAHYWIQAGLFPFSSKAAINYIPLCSSCHGAFDCSCESCWVFLPMDLNFFTRHEIEGQLRHAQVSSPSGRIVPTVKKYHDHLASKGLVSHSALVNCIVVTT